MEQEYVSFFTGIDANGKLFVEPKKMPKTKEGALVAVKALQLYEVNYPNAYLKLKDADAFFKVLEDLLKG